ncbi:hypothetical protein BN938_2304 [Mucinivorans hirudinis]|uniref:Uncharacterized protein n=1 Tax=Mucinivorans hirudinis TaxID=1433126 RepID=A0A060R9S7_9BACT|nr:hypothetical protein BN938_2304 [Mucinivorans hirudinis]
MSSFNRLEKKVSLLWNRRLLREELCLFFDFWESYPDFTPVKKHITAGVHISRRPLAEK